MAKKMLIDATHAEETRVVVVDGNKVEEFDFESENKRQLAGNIYLAKVTRVEPSLQAAFIDYGGNRHGFLAFAEIHPDYYQIPVADREALLAEEMALNRSTDDEDAAPAKPRRNRRSKAEAVRSDDAVTASDPSSDQDGGSAGPDENGGTAPADDEIEARTAAVIADIPGMDIVDLKIEGDDDEEDEALTSEGFPEDDGGPYRAMDDASQRDSEIESVADEDVNEEIRQPRKPRPRRYKIQEVVKVRQIMLVQVVKEERGNKGAALTTYLSLAGRYCVLMPNTARGGGISRKITNVTDRKKLKQIAAEIDVPRGAGLIIRTAGSQRTKSEIKRDYEYLQRLWEQIRELTLKSIAPTKIYEEGDLIKRSIRDLYNREIDEVFVEGAEGYKTAKSFMKMIMPSHAKNVKLYADPLPLFARYQVESYLASMFNPTVQLKSGGYIVIGVTEALVAIDVNSGRSTKEGSIEDTALKTNLEAAEEIARQLRLRDLAGLIVIDFIDMEERRNNAAVEKRFKERLKTDRARIQVGRISAFGLLEMSRQRLRPGMLEASTQPCPACHGTGLLRSDDSLGLQILRQVEEEGTKRKTLEVLVKAPINVVNFLMNHKREHIAGIEQRYGMAVRVEGDPRLVSPDFSIEKFKTQTRVVEAVAPVISVDPALMDEIDEAEIVDASDLDDIAPEAEDVAPEPEETEEGSPNKKRRRRRRRRKTSGRDGDEAGSTDQPADADDGEESPREEADAASDDETPNRSGRSRRSRGGRSRKRSQEISTEPTQEPEAAQTEAVVSGSAYAAGALEGEATEAEATSQDVSEALEPAPVPSEPEEEVASAMPAAGAAADAGAVAPAQEAGVPDHEVIPPTEGGAGPVEGDALAPSHATGTRDPATTDQSPQPVLEHDADVAVDEKPTKSKRRGWWSFGG